MLADKFVVQIDIFCTSASEVYVSNEERIFIKKLGSLNLLSTKETLEFMRLRLEPRHNGFWRVLAARNLNPLRVDTLSAKERRGIRDHLEELLDRLAR